MSEVVVQDSAAQAHYTPNDPVPGDEPEAREASPTYWQQTIRDFKREKLAMVALTMVFVVATIAVFCPLIANSRPYYIKMVWEDQYDEAYFIVLDAMDRLTGYEAQDAALERGEIVENLNAALTEMKRSLAPAHESEFDEIAGELRDYASSKGGSPAIVPTLERFEEQFDVMVVDLEPYGRFPAIRGLNRNEVFLIFFYLFFVPLWFMRGQFAHLRNFLLLLVVPPVILTAIWMSVFPEIQDTFPYRLAYESEEFIENEEWSVVQPMVPYGENENLTSENRQPPTFLMEDSDKTADQHFHLLGTDTNGRDVLSRMIYGARISMMIGIVAVSIYVSIGIFLGAIAGFYGGWTDMALSRLIEIVICFPVLFLILSVQAFLEPSIFNIMVALGLVGWTGVARLQRGEFLRLINLDFVQAVRSLGGSNFRIIFRHVLPNALGPILVLVSFGMAGSILVESALSFLGFGVPQPTASWGDLLNNGRNDIYGTWWLTVFPGVAIFLTITCFNLIGEGVRDALDPRRQR